MVRVGHGAWMMAAIKMAAKAKAGMAILAGNFNCLLDHVGMRLTISAAQIITQRPIKKFTAAKLSKNSGCKNQINMGRKTNPAPPGAGTPAKNPFAQTPLVGFLAMLYRAKRMAQAMA